MTDDIPFTPLNGRVLVRALPYKPSKIIEVSTHDRADENEGIVVALSPCRYGRRKTNDGWKHTGDILKHDVRVGDRVFFPGSYQDDDTMTFNGQKYRAIDSWELIGVMSAPQPEGFDHPVTGEKLSGDHPLIA